MRFEGKLVNESGKTVEKFRSITVARLCKSYYEKMYGQKLKAVKIENES